MEGGVLNLLGLIMGILENSPLPLGSNRRTSPLHIHCACHAIFIFLAAQLSQAATLTWQGPATSTWDTSTTSIWTSGTAWNNTTPDSAVFGSTGVGTINMASTGIAANVLTFQVTGYTLANTGTLTLAGPAPSITTTTGITTISADVGGTAGFTKNGAGTLVLSKLTNTGLMRVSAGILEVNSRTGDSPYEIDSTGTLRIGYSTGGGYAGTGLTIHGAGAAAVTGLYLKGGTSYNTNGGLVLVDAPTTIRQYGTGVAEIGAFDVNTNPMIVRAAASGSATDANVNFVSRGYGMSITIEAGTNTATGDFILNGALDVNHSGNGFYKRGAGSLLLNSSATANNQYVHVMAGSILTGVNGALGVNAKIEVRTGAKLVLNGTTQNTSSLLGGGGSIVGGSATASAMNVVQINATTFSGVIGGTGTDHNNLSFSKAGTATLTLTGNNTYTGATTVTNGVLQVGNAGTTGTLGTGAVSIAAAGMVVFDRSNAYAAANAITNAGNVKIQGAGTTTLSGVISGAGSLTQSGSGTAVLAGANIYTGSTTVNDGTLQLNFSTENNRKLSDSAALNLNGGTVNSVGGSHAEVVGSTILGSGTDSRVTRSSGTSVLNLNAITRNSGSTLDFGAASIARTDNTNTNGILGPWATINGTDWAVNSTNLADGLITAYSAYNDVTRQSSGTKVIPNTAAANVRITEGTGTSGNITLAAATTTINSLNQSASGGTSAATIDTGGNTLATSGILAGNGAGGLTIGTSVGSGVLRATGDELIIQNQSIGAIRVNSTITNNGAGTATALTTAGLGSTILGASNTYTGATMVTSGSLQVGSGGIGSTGTGPVTVKAGSTILGTGTVRGSTFTAEKNSTIRPGDSTATSSHGTLTFTPVTTGSHVIAAGSSTILGITTATNQSTLDPHFGGNLPGTAGYKAYVNGITGVGAHDQLIFNGTTGSTLNFAGNLQVPSSGFTAQKGQVFNLLDWATLVTTNFTSFNVGTNYRDGSGDDGSQFDLPNISGTGLYWDVSLFTSSGSIVVVPEPSRALLVLFGFFVLVPTRRRK